MQNEPKEMPTHDIVVKPNRARKNFDPQKLVDLADSIKKVGLIEPLVVTREGEKVVLVAGERRLRSALVAGLKTVPVVFKSVDNNGKIEGIDETQQRLIELHENIGRQDLSWSEEAFLTKEIHELQQKQNGIGGPGMKTGWTEADTAKSMGTSVTSVDRKSVV